MIATILFNECICIKLANLNDQTRTQNYSFDIHMNLKEQDTFKSRMTHP